MRNSKVLTFTGLIETGVINRNDSGAGGYAPAKKLITHKGTKVFFSDKSYLSALWDHAASPEFSGDWTPSAASANNGPAQRVSTIIDSEEFDFGGTMITKGIKHQRDRALLVTKGMSLNNHKGFIEFLTNMRLSSKAGTTANPYQREEFHGIYKLSGILKLDAVGEQEIEIPLSLAGGRIELEDNMTLEMLLQNVHEGVKSLIEEAKSKNEETEDTEIMDHEEFVEAWSSLVKDEQDIKIGKYKSNKIELTFQKVDNKFEKYIEQKDYLKLLEDIVIDSPIMCKYLLKYINKASKVKKTRNTGDLGLSITFQQNPEGVKDATPSPPKNTSSKEQIKEKIEWLYEVYQIGLGYKIPSGYKSLDEMANKLFNRVEEFEIIEGKKFYTVKISLTNEEKYRRVEMLLRAIMEATSVIEGQPQPIYPSFIVWSLDQSSPKLHNFIDLCIDSYEPLKINMDKLKEVNGSAPYNNYGYETINKELSTKLREYYRVPIGDQLEAEKTE